MKVEMIVKFDLNELDKVLIYGSDYKPKARITDEILVRCRDCSHGHKLPGQEDEVACDIFGGIWRGPCYCSNGERRETKNRR